MNHFERRKSDILKQGIAKIEQTQQDERYDVYADGEGPLGIGALDPRTRISPDFLEVLRKYGWPSQIEDGAIEPVHEYGSAAEFIEALRADGQPYLNNLNAMFEATPTEEFSMDNLYGIKPPLHRARVVAPDLFEGIRDLYRGFREQKPRSQHADLTAVLRENEVVAEQVFKAFKILGRLVKTTDADMELKQVNPSASGEPIESVQKYLTT